MPTFMKMIAAAAMVVAAQGAPVLDANEALDARMAKLEATVKELEQAAMEVYSCKHSRGSHIL